MTDLDMMGFEASEALTRRAQVLAGIRNGSWLDSRHFDDPEAIVDGIITAGYGLLTGPPKVGKSWLTLDVALAVASGGSALGSIPVRQRPVLLLALEDGYRRLQYRSRKLLREGEPIPAGLDFYIEPGPEVLTDVLPGWLDQHGADKPLVILDTLGTVQPQKLAGESEYQRDYRTGQMLKGFISDYDGAGLLVVHHTRKMGSSDWMDSTSGTNGVNGSADFTVSLSAPREGTEGTLNVTGRDAPSGSYAVNFTEGRWVIAGDSLDRAADMARARTASAGVGDVATQIITVIAEAGEPLGPTVVASRIPGLSAQAAGTYLGRLAESGRLVKTGRGRYALPSTGAVESVDLWKSASSLSTSQHFQHPSSGDELLKAGEVA